jgi:hypothetical protein
MKQDESYFVDIEVPEAVLLSDSVVVQKLVHPNTSGAVWYRADEASLASNDEGVVQKWLPQEGLGEVAVPVKPNADHLRLSLDGGLNFEREVNAGLVVKNALIDPTKFSCAIRYSSNFGDARTLLTINPNDHDTYLFLSEKDGHISWQDQKDQSAVTIPAPKGGGWIVVGFDAGKLSLSVACEGESFGKPSFSEGLKHEVAVDFSGANDVFIGCRSHRKGILKTLGVSRIHDLLIWVDQDLCGGDHDVLHSVCRHCENIGANQ